MLGPTLTTERLILRPPIQADLDGWAAAMADEQAQRFIGGAQPRPVAWRKMSEMTGAWALLGYGMFSVLRKDTGRWIGRVGPNHPEGWPGTEIGWGLSRDAWGQGFALEAATATMDFAVDHLGWTDIVHCIDPDNLPSIVLARRLGSERIGPAKMPAPREDAVIDLYGQTARQWRARQAARR
jgi:RimJ/RimL family protein N-acetyltransferase